MTEIRPISPEEVEVAKARRIPPVVFEVFNELIAKVWDGHRSVVKQPEVVDTLVKHGYERREIFDNHLLDVEDAYREVGWMVSYDKPAYNETYDAFFEFTSGKGK